MKSATARATPPRGKRAVYAKATDLHKMIQAVQRKLEAEIGELRDELRASETTLAAARLQALNQRQARKGVDRLRTDLKALRERGIVDEHGKRVRGELPAEMVEEASDVV